MGARGKSDEAVRYYLEALRRHPDNAPAHYHLGMEQLKQGKMDDAIASLREAVRLDPDQADAHFQLAVALASRRVVGDAITQYQEALRLNPDSPVALNNLAWLLATGPEVQLRNGPQAVQLAEHACELTAYQQTVFVGTLAAAYAEAGRSTKPWRQLKKRVSWRLDMAIRVCSKKTVICWLCIRRINLSGACQSVAVEGCWLRVEG